MHEGGIIAVHVLHQTFCNPKVCSWVWHSFYQAQILKHIVYHQGHINTLDITDLVSSLPPCSCTGIFTCMLLIFISPHLYMAKTAPSANKHFPIFLLNIMDKKNLLDGIMAMA